MVDNTDKSRTRALTTPPGEKKSSSVALTTERAVEIAQNTFDIRTMNLGQLAVDLKASLDKPQPTSIFFKGRQNRKIELDNERKSLLLFGIERLRTNNASMLELQADAFLTEETMQHIVGMRRLEFKISFEKTTLEMDVYKKEIDYKIKSIDTQFDRDREALFTDMLSNEARRKALVGMDIANARAVLENESIMEQNRMNRAKASILEKIEREVDFSTYPDAFKLYIIGQFIANSGSEYSQYEREQISNEFLRDQLGQDVRKKTYEADSLKSKAKSDKSQADVHRASADVSIQDLESELDEED